MRFKPGKVDELAKQIGKIAVLVGVCPGFVGNRMARTPEKCLKSTHLACLQMCEYVVVDLKRAAKG